MNTNNCAALIRPGLSDREAPEDGHFNLKRGEIELQPEGVWVVCPGCCTLTLLPDGITQPGSPHRWQRSGTPEKPTLTPSINHPGCWHGYLTDGQFVSC